MSLKINKDQIASVTQYNKLKSHYYDEWTEAGKDTLFFGLLTINKWDGGYYSCFLGTYRNKEQWEKDGYYEPVSKGGLYYNPHLIIKMSNGESITKSFETVTSMEWWVADNLKDVNLIKIVD